jgi:hypothetical protein
MNNSPSSNRRHNASGMVIVGVILLSLAFLTLVATLGLASRDSLLISGSKAAITDGYFAAEGGLNQKFDQLRNVFGSFSSPLGTPAQLDPPCGLDGTIPDGTGDFACTQSEFGTQRVVTSLKPISGKVRTIRVPPGDRFQDLFAFESQFEAQARSWSINSGERTSSLFMRMRNRSVPLYQFAAFYGDKDLEFYNGPGMVVNGPIHANGDVYLDTEEGLDILGRISATGSILRGKKHLRTCFTGPLKGRSAFGAVIDFPQCGEVGRHQVTGDDISSFVGTVQQQVKRPELPTMQIVRPKSGGKYWDSADLRLVVDVDADGKPDDFEKPVKIVDSNGDLDVDRTEYLWSCLGMIKRHVPEAYEGCVSPPVFEDRYRAPHVIPPPYEPGGPGTGNTRGATNRYQHPFLPDVDVSSYAGGFGSLMRRVSMGNDLPRPHYYRNSLHASLPPDVFPPDIKGPRDIEENPAWPRKVVRFSPAYESGPFGNPTELLVSNPNKYCARDWNRKWIYNPLIHDIRSTCSPDNRMHYAMLEVDMNGLLACVQNSIDDGRNILTSDVLLDDKSDNGLVIFATIRGPLSETPHSLYGVLLGRAKTLQHDRVNPKTLVKGLTIASDQAVFIAGDYNTPENQDHHVASAIVADSIHVLSEAVCDLDPDDGVINKCNEDTDVDVVNGLRWPRYYRLDGEFAVEDARRRAANTSVRTAFVTGTPSAGGGEGEAYRDQMFDAWAPDLPARPWASGGVMNVINFHENWNRTIFDYTGSIVSLWEHQHYDAPFLVPGIFRCKGLDRASPYEAPDRRWKWDDTFGAPEGLPPLTPMLTYVQQEVFEKAYEQERLVE